MLAHDHQYTVALLESLSDFRYPLPVTADVALQKQIERYRQMTGEQRLAREGIRRQYPSADSAEVERRLRQRLELARAA